MRRFTLGRPALSGFSRGTRIVILLSIFSQFTHPVFSEQIPENLASKASIEANSEFSERYRAENVIDGEIPPSMSKSGDLGKSWCVRKEQSGDQGSLVFRWKSPVLLKEMVYFGRTSWYRSECWKDFRLVFDAHEGDAVTGTFEQRDGAQHIRFSPRKVETVRIDFLNSYGGPNPGAAEIMFFSKSPTEEEWTSILPPHLLPKFRRPVEPTALRKLVARLSRTPGRTKDFPEQCRKWEERIHDLESTEENGEGLSQKWRDLQKEILLHDIDSLIVIKRHEINASHVYTYHYEGFRPGGGLYRVDLKKPGCPMVELMRTPRGQILDLDLSFDSKTILFSWRADEDSPYQLWTIGIDGTGLRRVARGPWHDYNPCWLPDGDIAFLSSREPQFAYCWHAPVGTLYRISPDGSNLIRLSANYLNDFTPSVLADGRLLYTRWEYVDRPAIPIQSLWAIHPDGTNLQGYFGNRVLSPGTFMEARSIPGTDKIVCTMTGHNGPTRGAIGVVDRRLGLNAQAAITNITPETPVPNVDQGNGNTSGSKDYSSPWPLDAHRLLVSARGPVLVRTFDFDPETGAACLSEVIPEPTDGMQFFCARPIAPRPMPPVLGDVAADMTRTAKHPEKPISPIREVAYRESSEPLQMAEREGPPYATLLLKDVYQGLGPEVKRGEVASIRIVREMQKTVRIDPSYRAFGFQFPVISCGATYAGKMILGDVPVADDGSACFRVGMGATRKAIGYGSRMDDISPDGSPVRSPSTGPIYFIALDHQGRALQRMRSFTHLMPGEIQTCVGCHEPRRHAPPYRGSLAMHRTPVDPELPSWLREKQAESEDSSFAPGFHFVRLVQPVLDRYCVECHHPRSSQSDLDLSGSYTDFFNVAYESLARENQGPKGSPYVNWIPTYNGHEQNILLFAPKSWGSYQSRLAELCHTGHPDEKGNPRFKMDDASREIIYAWIDLNVPYYGSSETAYPENIGCRRLYPAQLDAILEEVGKRRCAGCHDVHQLRQRTWTRITDPQLNPFLLAPLAQSAGGTQKCGEIVFTDKKDPDYQRLLRVFDPLLLQIERRPRLDMPGGKPAEDVCRLTH